MLHIRDCLPDIKSKIASMMTDVQGSIDELGDPADGNDHTRLGSTLLRLISKFSASFTETVDGRKFEEVGDTSELYGGARISYIFNEVFGKAIRHMDPFAGLSDADIRTAIANANGPRAALFVPEISFDLLVRRQIARLEQPGLQCVDLVFAEMQRMAYQSETGELSRFPQLRTKVFEIVNRMLRDCLAPTQTMIASLIKIELAYINTSHPDFIGGKQAVAQLTKRMVASDGSKAMASPPAQQLSVVTNTENVPTTNAVSERPVSGVFSPPERPPSGAFSDRVVSADAAFSSPTPGPVAGETPRGFFGLFRPAGPGVPSDRRANPPQSKDSNGNAGGLVKLSQVPDRLVVPSNPHDREKIETEIIKNLISSYFDIVKKNFSDLVPKTIMHFLVSSFREGLQNSLVSQLYKEAVIAELMKENEDVAAKRKSFGEMRELLQKALEIVNEVRDFNTFK
jgi:dynamin 1-like protein